MGIDSEKIWKNLEIVNLNQSMLSVNGFWNFGFSRKWISNQKPGGKIDLNSKSKIPFQRKISNPKPKSGILKNFWF